MSPRRLLFVELSVGVRTARFWGVVLRNAIPLAGVVLLGWPGTLLVAYYVIEIWWFLALRMAAEIAVDDELKGDTPLGAGRLTGLTLKNFVPGALVIGVIFFTAIGIFIMAFLGSWDWRAFLAGDAPKQFLLGLAILAVFLLVESVRYGLHYYYRAGTKATREEYVRFLAKGTREEDLRFVAIFYRIPFVVLAGPVLFLLMSFRHAVDIVAVFLTLVSIWIEATPRHVAKVLGMPKGTRRMLFRRRGV